MRRWNEPSGTGAVTSRAWRSADTRSATSSASGSRSEGTTSAEWSRTTSSFSAAMSGIVGPSQRVCSSPTPVSTVSFEGITLVAS